MSWLRCMSLYSYGGHGGMCIGRLGHDGPHSAVRTWPDDRAMHLTWTDPTPCPTCGQANK